jgi:surfeit locus 1 family protein
MAMMSAALPAARRIVWPTLFAGGAFLVLLALGTWQVERLQWKERLIAERHAAVTAPAIDLPRSLEAARGMDYRHVRAAGSFLNDRELYLGATSPEGRPGYHVVTPLRLADGAVLLVDRGFVPQEKRAPETRATGEIVGPTTVSGLLRLPLDRKPYWFLPENSAERNYWFYVDPPAMAKAAKLDGVLPYYIDADAAPNPGGLPVGGQTRLDLPNDHLQYAITWYALAAGLLGVYIVFIRRRLAEGAASP